MNSFPPSIYVVCISISDRNILTLCSLYRFPLCSYLYSFVNYSRFPIVGLQMQDSCQRCSSDQKAGFIHSMLLLLSVNRRRHGRKNDFVPCYRKKSSIFACSKRLYFLISSSFPLLCKTLSYNLLSNSCSNSSISTVACSLTTILLFLSNLTLLESPFARLIGPNPPLETPSTPLSTSPPRGEKYPFVLSPAKNFLPVIGIVKTGFGEGFDSEGWRRWVSWEICRAGSGW